MDTQLELKPVQRVQRSGPLIEPNDPRIEKMVTRLRGRGWMKRHVLREELGWDDRIMRAIKAAGGRAHYFDDGPGVLSGGGGRPQEFFGGDQPGPQPAEVRGGKRPGHAEAVSQGGKAGVREDYGHGI